MIDFLSTLSFSSPWILLGLVAIPLIWIVLRAIPPTPVRHIFPPVILLIGIRDFKHSSDKMPWWLLLLRSTTLIVLIIGMAGPTLNKQTLKVGNSNTLIILDGSWAAAQAWTETVERVNEELSRAGRRGVCSCVHTTRQPKPRGGRPTGTPLDYSKHSPR